MVYHVCVDCGKRKYPASPSPRCGSCAQKFRAKMYPNLHRNDAQLKRTGTPAEILDYCKTHTLQQAGDKYGVTRERIRQVLLKNFPDRQKHRMWFVETCRGGCGKIVKSHNEKDKFVCPVCYRFKQINGSYTISLSGRTRHHLMGDCVRCHKRPARSKGYCKVCRVWKFAKDHPDYYQKQLDRNRIYMHEYPDKIKAYARRYLHTPKAIAAKEEWRKKNMKNVKRYWKRADQKRRGVKQSPLLKI